MYSSVWFHEFANALMEGLTYDYHIIYFLSNCLVEDRYNYIQLKIWHILFNMDMRTLKFKMNLCA